ncbi:MAG: transcriptional regulator [Corynebacteriales bacterium]|nr:transcriptional regulator [Mycobacteriales bacterium]
MSAMSAGPITGYVLKLARESAALSQDATAELLHVDAGTVQGWESGRRHFGAVSFRQALTVRRKLTAAGANSTLIRLVDVANTADQVVEELIIAPPERHKLADFALSALVMTNEVSQLLSWLLSSREPPIISQNRKQIRRRGPVAKAPALTAAERVSAFANLDVIADRAARRSELSLLHRQARFLSGFGSPSHGGLTSFEAREFGRVVRQSGWSSRWPQARSIAMHQARHGDPELLQKFITHAYGDVSCTLAELNYSAYWVGELQAQFSDDTFMANGCLEWSGERLRNHLAERLKPDHYLAALSINTLASLRTAKPWLFVSSLITFPLLVSVEMLLDAECLDSFSHHQAELFRRALLESK